MSNYLRNLKISAHQSYLSFKPCIFRAQSYPTIGFYSCAEQLGSPSPTSLGLNVSINELGQHLPVGRSSETHSTRNAEISTKIITKRLKASCDIVRSQVKTRSSLSVHRVPSDSLFKLNSNVRVERVPVLPSGSQFSGEIKNLYEQLEKNNVTIFSGYLESSPYHIVCIGAENESLPKVALLSELECNALRFAEPRRPSGGADKPSGKPSEEQLTKIYLALAETVPRFFTQTHNYTIYNKDVVFENSIRGVTTRGLDGYMKQLVLARVLGHLRFAHVKMEILKMTQHPEDGSVRIRWRVSGLSGFRVLFMIYRFWQWKKVLNSQSEWIDGFSIFYIGADGLVYKHICDKMIPDESRETKVRQEGGMAVKLALTLGVAPQIASDLLGGGLDGAITTMGRTS